MSGTEQINPDGELRQSQFLRSRDFLSSPRKQSTFSTKTERNRICDECKLYQPLSAQKLFSKFHFSQERREAKKDTEVARQNVGNWKVKRKEGEVNREGDFVFKELMFGQYFLCNSKNRVCTFCPFFNYNLVLLVLYFFISLLKISCHFHLVSFCLVNIT